MKFLCEYNFDVHYTKGKENVVVDALSRQCHEDTSMVTGIDLREHIMHHLPEDELYAKIFQIVHSQRILEGKFVDCSLYYEGIL